MNKHVRDLLNRWDTLTTGEQMHDAVMMVRYKQKSRMSKADETILALLDKEAKS